MKNALLIIDVQRGLFDPEPRPHEADVVLERINFLTMRARDKGVPVIWIQHEDAGELAFLSPGWQLASSLLELPTDLKVGKKTADSFLNTDLGGLLSQLGTESIVVAGYASEFCVDTTVRRAAALGFPVLIAADAHTTHDKPHASGEAIRRHHNATLSAISSFGPQIRAVPCSEVEFE
ncbi:Aminoglycoside 6'-N-acetyltransferase [Bordetella tumbae]|uniref:cysteine hydrolase family protein n=1 Tax=Bordetella tumbae TaxID=1649139 RepID=UPI0039EF6592